MPLAERKVLVAELFELVTGRVKDFVLKHDAVRIVQTAIKYANLEQRKMMARELKGEFRQLAESRYAKFLIGKLLVHGSVSHPTCLRLILLITAAAMERFGT